MSDQAPLSFDSPEVAAFIRPEQNEETYGGVGGQALTAAAGAARGATLGLSDLALTKSGLVKPETLKDLSETNPVANFTGNMAGGAGLIAATGGLGGLAEGAGLAGAATAAAGEGALFGAGNAVSDYAMGDPDLNAEKVLTHIGMGAVLGGTLGLATHGIGNVIGSGGALKGTVADSVLGSAEKANSTAETENVFSKALLDHPEVQDSLDALKKQFGTENTPAVAPLGMVTDNQYAQRAESALLNGAPTYSGRKRSQLYNEVYDLANKAVEDILPDSRVSKAELGGNLKGGVVGKIEQESQPINDLYGEIKPAQQAIPVSPLSLKRVLSNVKDLEVAQLDTHAGQKMFSIVENALEKGDLTVDRIKNLRKIISDSSTFTEQSSNGKYILGELQDRLKSLEENTIDRYAKNIVKSHEDRLSSLSPEDAASEQAIWGDKISKIQGLLEKKKAADEAYRPFISKVQTLAEKLGKNKISGAQGAINFIQELEPEKLTQKLFDKNDSEFLKFFSKNFPDEMNQMREYQKAVLREQSTDKNGVFSVKTFYDKVFGKNGLEKEIRENLFDSRELANIKHSQVLVSRIPRNFNPSNTENASAFGKFFESPVKATGMNVRDFGIEGYIKAMSRLPESMRPPAEQVGMDAAQKFSQMSAAQDLADKTSQRISDGAKAIFSNKDVGRGATLGAFQGLHGSYQERTNRIMELSQNTDALSQHLANNTEGIHKYMPNISQGVQNKMLQSVQFLNSKIPQPKSQMQLSAKWEPSLMQKEKFDKYYDAVNNPVGILDQVKKGRVSSEALEAVGATHPKLLADMRTQVQLHMDTDKAKKMPYDKKLSLAKFLGQPLDESMLPQVVISNQQTFQAPQKQNMPSAPKPNGQMKNMDVASRSGTQVQNLMRGPK